MPRRTLFKTFCSITALTLGFAIGLTNLRAGAQTIVHLGLSKNVGGVINLSKSKTWKCKMDTKILEMFSQVIEMSTEVRSSGDDCDEIAKSLNGKIAIRWEATGRSGPIAFGVHEGKFVWIDGNTKAEGSMQGTFGCGTHRKPLEDCEKCRELNHFEGLLEGHVIAGPLKGERFVASYSGKFTFEKPTDLKGRVYMTIDGVHIQPCNPNRK